ncbi:MAG: hypothetical protein RR555_04560 [Bacteroidales bacterium]
MKTNNNAALNSMPETIVDFEELMGIKGGGDGDIIIKCGGKAIKCEGTGSAITINPGQPDTK